MKVSVKSVDSEQAWFRRLNSKSKANQIKHQEDANKRRCTHIHKKFYEATSRLFRRVQLMFLIFIIAISAEHWNLASFSLCMVVCTICLAAAAFNLGRLFELNKHYHQN